MLQLTGKLLLTLMLSTILAAFSSAQSLAVGADAPRVAQTADDGTTLDLATLYGANNYTLVYFYPKADTPGCTAQGCSLRDAYAQLADAGVAVVGVSTDDVADQRVFREKHRLPFPLLADTDKKVVTAFGVPTRLSFASRQAYLVQAGKIVYADHEGSTRQQAADILGFIAKQAAAASTPAKP
jgi:thioredoxin-dependent peroxiredoxin